jgi:L-alanine-DL-glutamate epimerase-like enolase superfamily enzyme
MVASGYRTIKLKVGRPEIHQDLEMVRAVRKAIGDDIAIRVDANAGYSPVDALVVTRALGELNIEHFEQPVAGEDFAAMARLLRLGAVSIMADESVHTAQDAIRLVREKAADGLKIKISKVGGFIEARRILDVAEAAGIKVIIGNGICSSIEAASELQLACAYPHIYPVAEMVGPAKLAGDLAEKPFDLRSGKIQLTAGAGLGVDLSEAKLKEYTIA